MNQRFRAASRSIPAVLLPILALFAALAPASSEAIAEPAGLAFCADEAPVNGSGCNPVRRTLLDDFNRPSQDGPPGPGWELIPYLFASNYSEVGVKREQATQDSALRRYAGAQWETPLRVTHAMSVTMGPGFNADNPYRCMDSHELYLNLVHDQGLLTDLTGPLLRTPISGYELGVYAGLDINGDPDPRNAFWELYRFNVPGYKVVARGEQGIRQGDRIAIAYRDGLLSAIHQRDGGIWQTVASGVDRVWDGMKGKPALDVTPGYSFDDAASLAFRDTLP